MRRTLLVTAAALILAVPRPALAGDPKRAMASKVLKKCVISWKGGVYNLAFPDENKKQTTRPVRADASVTFRPTERNSRWTGTLEEFIKSRHPNMIWGQTDAFTRVEFSYYGDDPENGLQALDITQ